MKTDEQVPLEVPMAPLPEVYRQSCEPQPPAVCSPTVMTAENLLAGRHADALGLDALMVSDTPSTIRVAVVATHRLATDLLAGWLNGGGLGAKITPYADPASAAGGAHGADLIVLGNLLNFMASADIVDWIGTLRRMAPGTALVVVSDSVDGRQAIDCLRAGAQGVIPTSLSLPLAVAALRLVLEGGVYIPTMALGLDVPPKVEDAPAFIPSRVEAKDIRGITLTALPEERAALASLGLSPRESDILLLLQRGASNRQVATELGISENTVMVHVRNVMRKLGATNRTQAVYTARRLLRENAGTG